MAASAQTPTTTPQVGPKQIKLSTKRLHLQAGRAVAVSGHVMPHVQGVSMRLQVRKPGRWVTLTKDHTAANGRFRLKDRRHAATSAPVRVVAKQPSGPRIVKPIGRLNVYRTAQASWYGPGLYGGHLGCGGTLTAGTLGVANKSLPCGTKVTLRHGSRSVRVRVIDRGPYVAGREYDLTAATAQKIGFSGHGGLQVTR